MHVLQHVRDIKDFDPKKKANNWQVLLLVFTLHSHYQYQYQRQVKVPCKGHLKHPLEKGCMNMFQRMHLCKGKETLF